MLIAQILDSQRGTVYGTLASIFGSLLGFVITTVSIVIAFAHARATRHRARQRTLPDALEGVHVIDQGPGDSDRGSIPRPVRRDRNRCHFWCHFRRAVRPSGRRRSPSLRSANRSSSTGNDVTTRDERGSPKTERYRPETDS
jgi:hypothetical protein